MALNKTKIGWVRNPDGTPGFSWNPISGCLNGCDYCYARRLANTRLKERYLENNNCCDFREGWFKDPFHPRFWENKLTDDKNNPLSRKKPIGIFTCNMGDLFGIGVPEGWTKRVLDYIRLCPQHRFYLLTKQPQNLQKFSPFPDNCFVGVSATGNKAYHTAIDVLSEIEAKVKYLSIEPFLERIVVDNYLINAADWLILGSQTKPTVHPKIEWVREIINAADGYGIPVFLKDSLYDLFMNVPHSDLYWEDMSTLRQEMPTTKV